MRLEDLDGQTQDQQFETAAKNAGVPTSVLRNMWATESANGTNMGPSSAGATGHFQQMPQTQAELERRAGRKLDSYDFQQGLYMASELLKENMQHFGTVEKAVQAYNGGWDEAKWDNKETRGYLQKVMGADGQPSSSEPFPDAFNVVGGEVRDYVNQQQLALRTHAAMNSDDPSGKMTPNEKAALEKSQALLLMTGQDVSDVAKLAAVARGNPEALVDAAIPTGEQPAQPNYMAGDSALYSQLAREREQVNIADNRGYGETLVAALNENSVANKIWHEISMTTARDTDRISAPDPEWQAFYKENRVEQIKGLTPEGQLQMDGARNKEDADTIRADDVEQQKYQQVLQDSEHPILWAIAGSLLDPIALGAGVATDGLFQAGRIAAISSRVGSIKALGVAGEATAAAAPKMTAVGEAVRFGAAGATANVELTAMMQLMGEKTTVQDYLHAAAAGLALGALGGLAHYGLTKADQSAILSEVDLQHGAAADSFMADYAAAKLNNPQGTVGELYEAARQIGLGRMQNDVDAMMKPVPVAQQTFARNRGVEFEFSEADRARIEPGKARYLIAKNAKNDFADLTDEQLRDLVADAKPVDEVGASFIKAKDITGYKKAVAEMEARGIKPSVAPVFDKPAPETDVLAPVLTPDQTIVPPMPEPTPTADGKAPTGGAATAATNREGVRRAEAFGQVKSTEGATATTADQEGILLIGDQDKLGSIAGLYQDAYAFMASHPDVEANLTNVASKRNTRRLIGIQSTGSILRTDENVLARTIGTLIAEDAAGESGYRVMTASIDSKLRVQSYMNGYENSFMTNYQGWLRETGINPTVGTVETFTTGKFFERFNVEVAAEVRARTKPDYKPSAKPSVVRAANITESRLQYMGDDARGNGTLGSEFIPSSSIGYLPQQVNGAAVNKLSKTELSRLIETLEEQAIQDLGWSADEFTTAKVREYLKRNVDYATDAGGFNSVSPKTLREVAIEDLGVAYSAGKISQEQYLHGLETLRKGAARYTGKRIDWDLDAELVMDSGDIVPLHNFFVNDVVELMRGYANRTAGDVALAKFGILGDRDITLMAEALRSSKVGNPMETVPAFEQLISEIYNRPVSKDAHSATGKILRPVRQYTNLKLLGGTVFPQLAETANMVSHLGVSNTLNIVQNVPRLARQLADIKEGSIPQDSILASLDIVNGAPLGADEFQTILPRVFDENTGIVNGQTIGNITRVIAGGQLIHQKLSFMRVATTIQKRFVGEEIVKKSLRYINSGIEDAALRDMGITPELAAVVREHLPAIAKFNDRGYVEALDIRNMPAGQARDDFIAAVHRGTNQIIQGNYPGETGKWMRTELTQTLFQLRRFPAIAVEKQMLRQFRNFGTMRAMSGIVAATGIGTLIYYGRAQIAASLLPEREREKYLKERLAWGHVIGGATTYVSALGLSADAAGLLGGVSRMVNDSYDLGLYNSRGVPQKGLGSVVPSLGAVDDLYALSQNPSVKAGLGVLPLTNLPFALPAINWLKNAAKEQD